MISFLSKLIRLRRSPWDNVATATIAAGVIMMMQPASMTCYSYSFITTLIGTLLFVAASKFPE
jgi:hypothetical protein